MRNLAIWLVIAELRGNYQNYLIVYFYSILIDIFEIW